MDYCPKCEKKMVHLKKKSQRTVTLVLSCPKCGHTKTATHPNLNIKPINKNRRENLIVIGKQEQRYKTMPTIQRDCPKCANTQAYAWLLQLGSLEQSSTHFYRCTKCGYTYRECN